MSNEYVLGAVFYLDATPEKVAAYIRENRLVVKKIRCNTHAKAPKIADGYLTFYDLVCENKAGAKHHVYVWQDTVKQSHTPVLFRMELKFAEPGYFGTIGLPGITIIDPGETGKDEDEYTPPSYDEILKAHPEYFTQSEPIEIPETDEDRGILKEVKRVNTEMFRVPREDKPCGPEVVLDHMPIAPLDMEHRSLDFWEND